MNFLNLLPTTNLFMLDAGEVSSSNLGRHHKKLCHNMQHADHRLPFHRITTPSRVLLALTSLSVAERQEINIPVTFCSEDSLKPSITTTNTSPTVRSTCSPRPAWTDSWNLVDSRNSAMESGKMRLTTSPFEKPKHYCGTIL